ncbi:serine hydrolase domain-containing protein [Arthrobacter flavus]|uniref:Serine hydrolase domain-containing protein n=1 Tax=Arthrobacter flavus TaxID=95172 RepID=A0ABW4QBX6_9MICC
MRAKGVTGKKRLGAWAAALLIGCAAIWVVMLVHDDVDMSLSRPTNLETVTDAIDSAVPEALEAERVPGAAVAVIQDGAVVWSQGYGMASLGGEAVTSSTVFQVGSISKPVAAATVLGLADEAVLDLDTPVRPLLRGWRPLSDWPDADGVTVRRLLSHTAGIGQPGYLGLDPARPLPGTAESLNGATTGTAVTQIQASGSYSYSGGGYTLAQLVAEEATGQSFDELANRYVFEPIGLDSTGYACTQDSGATRYWAAGHDTQGRPIARYRYAEMAAAGLCTTVDDLGRFAAWLGSKDDHAELMRIPSEGTSGRYGLGVELYKHNGTTTAGHRGVNRGFHAQLIVNPGEDIGLVVMTNGDNGTAVIEAVLKAWQDA